MAPNPLQTAPTQATAAGSDGAAELIGALPNLVVIGAQKCGTSGLHYYLSLHPEVSMSRPKELNFFIEERNWPRGADWYRRHFDAGARVRGESSPVPDGSDARSVSRSPLSFPGGPFFAITSVGPVRIPCPHSDGRAFVSCHGASGPIHTAWRRHSPIDQTCRKSKQSRVVEPACHARP